MRPVPETGTVLPVMGTNSLNSRIAGALFPKVRHVLLTLLFTEPERKYYLSEIVRRSRVGTGAIQRELARLTSAGLIARTKEGPLVYYQADSSSPVYAELRALIAKTSGVAETIARDLATMKGRINAAFIFGSIARGSERSSSDIDLFIVGAVTLREVCSALLKTQETLGREINPTIQSLTEFQRRLTNHDAFISRVLAGPRTQVIGDVDEAGRVAD